MSATAAATGREKCHCSLGQVFVQTKGRPRVYLRSAKLPCIQAGRRMLQPMQTAAASMLQPGVLNKPHAQAAKRHGDLC